MEITELIEDASPHAPERSAQSPFRLQRWVTGLWIARPREEFSNHPTVVLSGRYRADPALTSPSQRRWQWLAPTTLKGPDGSHRANLDRHRAQSLIQQVMGLRELDQMPQTLREAFEELSVRFSSPDAIERCGRHPNQGL